MFNIPNVENNKHLTGRLLLKIIHKKYFTSHRVVLKRE